MKSFNQIVFTDGQNVDFCRKALNLFECKVKFNKADGTLRSMVCTTRPDQIPVSESTRKRMENPQVQAVFDLEKNEWRSFRWDSVVDFKINLSI